MVFTEYVKRRILVYYEQGFRAPTIAKVLEDEGIRVSRRGVAKFLSRVATTGSIERLAGSGRRTKQTDDVKAIVEEAMRKDDETTAVQLHALLTTKGYSLSLSTILRCRKSLGWTFRGSAYCQMIREANKTKRLQWAKQYLDEAAAENGFLDVIFTDETSVQLESHRRFCCRKRGEPPKNKPRYVTPVSKYIYKQQNKLHSYTTCTS